MEDWKLEKEFKRTLRLEKYDKLTSIDSSPKLGRYTSIVSMATAPYAFQNLKIKALKTVIVPSK
jgi:hypothetical protein